MAIPSDTPGRIKPLMTYFLTLLPPGGYRPMDGCVRPLALISLLISLLMPAPACHTSTKNAAKPEGSAHSGKPEAHEEGVITLSEEQIKSSGIIAAAVVAGTAREIVTVQGRVIPRGGQQAAVTSPFPGRLIASGKFPVLGDTVRQGQLLVIVEQELSAPEAAAMTERRIDLDAQVQQTEREVEQKTRDLDRARILYQGGVAPLKQLQQAETDLSIAQARHQMVVRARANYDALLSNTRSGLRSIRLTAPISGAITAVNAAPNQQVDNAKAIFEITNLETLWVEAQVYEDYLAAIRRVRAVEITTRAAPGTTLTGKFVTLTQVDPISKTQGVLFEVANRDHILAIGMNVEVPLPSDKISNGPVVPASAILEEQGHSIVFVERKPGVYERREVKAGSREGDRVIVTSGLAVGDRVVTLGAQILAAAGESKEEEH